MIYLLVSNRLSRLSIVGVLHIRWLVEEWSIGPSLLGCSASGLVLEQWKLVWLVSAFSRRVWIVLEVLLEHILDLVYSLTVINEVHALLISVMLFGSVSALLWWKGSRDRAASLSVGAHLILRLMMINPLLDFHVNMRLWRLQLFPHIVPEILPNIQKIIVRLRWNEWQGLFLMNSR